MDNMHAKQVTSGWRMAAQGFKPLRIQEALKNSGGHGRPQGNYPLAPACLGSQAATVVLLRNRI